MRTVELWLNSRRVFMLIFSKYVLVCLEAVPQHLMRLTITRRHSQTQHFPDM